MKKLTFTSLAGIFLLLIFFQYTAVAQTYNLVWSDEFNGSSLSTSNWTHEIGSGCPNLCGWGNNELQYYRAENTTVSGGALRITARRENFGGLQYTSSRIKTQGKRSWRYGRIEARMQVPMGQGFWPAFWMLGDNITSVGWPACGEIDIMEHINTQGVIHGTVHWQGPNGYASYGGSISANPANWNVYAIEWTSSFIRWFLNGALYHEINIQNSVNSTEEFHRNHFIIFNFAIGGNWPGFTVDNSRLPASLVVDWVRVYQQGSNPPPSGAPIGSVIWLRGSNSRFVSSENGQSPMMCNRTSSQAWEKFEVVNAGSGRIALRGANGRYVSSENGTSGMMCNRTSIGAWEQFTWIDRGGGRIALQGNNGRYVSSENGQSAMMCNRTSIGGWEEFTWGASNWNTTVTREAADEFVKFPWSNDIAGDDEQNEKEASVMVYPNPLTDGSLNINIGNIEEGSSAIISIYDQTGKTFFRKTTKESSLTINTNGVLSRGLYFVNIRNGSLSTVRKIVVK